MNYTCCLRDAYPVKIETEPEMVTGLILGYCDPSAELRFLVFGGRAGGFVVGRGETRDTGERNQRWNV